MAELRRQIPIPPPRSEADMDELRSRPETPNPGNNYGFLSDDDVRRVIVRDMCNDSLEYGEEFRARDEVRKWYSMVLKFQSEAEKRYRENYLAELPEEEESPDPAELDRMTRENFDNIPPPEYFDNHPNRANFENGWYEIYQQAHLIGRVLEQFHPYNWGRIINGWDWEQDDDPDQPLLSPSSGYASTDGWDVRSEEWRPFWQLPPLLHPPKEIKKVIEEGLTADNLEDPELIKRAVRTA
jgi:hypothetical protein